MVKTNPTEVEMKDVSSPEGSSVDGKEEEKKPEEVKKHPDLLTLEGMRFVSSNYLWHAVTVLVKPPLYLSRVIPRIVYIVQLDLLVLLLVALAVLPLN